MRLILSLLTFIAVPSLGFAHARFRPNLMNDKGETTFLSNTPPRNDSTGLKTAPCGNVARTPNPKVYKPGQEITVQWEETINHKGYFILKFSEKGETDFDKHILASEIIDTQDEALNSMNGETHKYSHKVKFPDLECSDCTLQLIQVMTEVPKNPDGTLPPSAYYYSCSDIQLSRTPIVVPDSSKPDIDSPGSDPVIKPQKPAKPGNVKVKKIN